MPWSLLPDGIERLTLVLPNGEVNIAALLNDVNADAPKQSKILVELVKVLPPESSFVLSDKGSTKRARSIMKFKGEIDKLYNSYKGSGKRGKQSGSTRQSKLQCKLFVTGSRSIRGDVRMFQRRVSHGCGASFCLIIVGR